MIGEAHRVAELAAGVALTAIVAITSAGPATVVTVASGAAAAIGMVALVWRVVAEMRAESARAAGWITLLAAQETEIRRLTARVAALEAELDELRHPGADASAPPG